MTSDNRAFDFEAMRAELLRSRALYADNSFRLEKNTTVLVYSTTLLLFVSGKRFPVSQIENKKR